VDREVLELVATLGSTSSVASAPSRVDICPKSDLCRPDSKSPRLDGLRSSSSLPVEYAVNLRMPKGETKGKHTRCQSKCRR